MVNAFNCIASYGYSRPPKKWLAFGETVFAPRRGTALPPHNRRSRLPLGGASRAARSSLLRLPYPAWPTTELKRSSGTRSRCPGGRDRHAAVRRPRAPGVVDPGAAAQRARGAIQWASRIGDRLGSVAALPVGAPLPNIAQHVVKAPIIAGLRGHAAASLAAAVSTEPSDIRQCLAATRVIGSPRVPARQAYSHCASVGSTRPSPGTRAFIFFRNCCASSQLTCSTGRFGSLKLLGLLPIAAVQSACVTGVSPSQKPLVSRTSCCGPSSS